MGAVTLGEIAVRFGLSLHGDPHQSVDHVATLKSAQPGALTFLANPKYRDALATTQATVVVLGAAERAACPVAALVASDPYAAYARIAQWLHPKAPVEVGVHPSAVIDATAQVAKTASVGPLAYVGPGVVLKERVSVAAGAMLMGDAVVGQDTQIGPRVVIYPKVRIGARGLVHGGAVIGADGFGLAQSEGQWIKVPQLGGVSIGDDVEIGANTTIDRGAIEDTVIEDDVRLDNQIQVGHNVRIGAHTAVAGCVGISGSTQIGQYCMIAGFVGIAGHLNIADRVVILGFSLVSHSIVKPGVYSAGVPVTEAKAWRRTVGRLRQLGDLYERVKRLERQDESDE
jgi:UDP-3-O-[3-hydroxymyristoyl] glucosamine N-acyltransferase